MFKLKLLVLSLAKRMWPKVTFFAILAVITALIANVIKYYIPDSVTYTVGADTVDSLLNILASSMLAVTTFSLTTMLSAFSSASSNATPRSTQLVIEDSTTQNVLATFLGSFLFSLAGIIAINAGLYDGSARLVLFAMSLVVVALILITLIRWIEKLTKLGRLGETTRLVEQKTAGVLRSRAQDIYLGANPLDLVDREALEAARPVYAKAIGYVQYLDIRKLSDLAEKNAWKIYVTANPGRFMTPDQPLARVAGGLSPETENALRCAFVIADQRTFEQDPRFGLCVLAEIGCRALSAAVNDFGTAIDVLGRLVRVLSLYAPAACGRVRYPRVWVEPLRVADLFEDAFSAIIHDCPGVFEVQVRLQKSLAALACLDDGPFNRCAKTYSARALKLMDGSALLAADAERLRALAVGRGY